MIAPALDRSFMKDLRNLDRRLGVKFNSEHFVVTYDRGHSDPVNILLVKDGEGGFRHPNKTDLEVIKGGDLDGNAESMKNRLSKLAYASELMRRKARENTKDNIRHMTRENRRFLSERIARLTNTSKANASVRRIP